jgi:2-oxoglutarate ferredoxin oxidoreductase subunit alpha
MEPVVPAYRTPPRLDAPWAVEGADGREPRVVRSLHLKPEDLEAHNRDLQAKFATIEAAEVRYATESMEDPELAIVAYGTAARVARTAVERAREAGMRVGLFRPISLWPFPSAALARLARTIRGLLVVELSAGQMVEDVRLAVVAACPCRSSGGREASSPPPARWSRRFCTSTRRPSRGRRR